MSQIPYVPYIGFLLYCKLEKLDREAHEHRGGKELPRRFHALFLFPFRASSNERQNLEVTTTWDEITKTPGADLMGEGFM